MRKRILECVAVAWQRPEGAREALDQSLMGANIRSCYTYLLCEPNSCEPNFPLH